jgi:kynurenine formamidase
VENLTGLSGFIGQPFTFAAVPAKVAGAGSLPVRACAVLGA